MFSVAARFRVERPLLPGVTDSKALSPAQRERAYHIILRCPDLLDFGVGLVGADEVDRYGADRANQLAMSRALYALQDFENGGICIDGTLRLQKSDEDYFAALGNRLEYRPKADLEVPCVSAASVLAKVLRDRHLTELAKDFPGYGFEKHAGYPTPAHKEAVQELGLSPEHRARWRA